MLAVRRFLLRRQCLLVVAIFLFINLIFYFLNIDLFTFPKWRGITTQTQTNRDELVLLVKHLEMEMENHTRSYKRGEKGVPQGCKQGYKLVVMVQSKTTNTDRRNIIRSTWGDGCTRCRKSRWAVFFLTGTSTDRNEMKLLDEEKQLHGDILPVNTIDSMRNITDKIKKGFSWVAKHCRFEYLLKTNDNVFVNIPTLYKYLDNPSTPREELWAGSVNWWSQVLRSGMYGVGTEYKRDFFPRYCSGAAYVLSRDVVVKFVQNFKVVPYLFIEDAYIGEVALKSGIDTTENKMFKYSQSGCLYNNSYISYHPVDTAACMMEMYQRTLPYLVDIYN